jgi:3-hydroxybutyryl-CoA dehydrogenase
VGKVGVVGAGTMGHGIAQVCAMAGYTVVLTDNDPSIVTAGLSKIAANLDKGVERGKVSAEVRAATLRRVSAGDLAAVAHDADFVVEAIPERLEWKQALFLKLESMTPAACVFCTNTSSLSIARIAAGLADPGRVVGAHFFNPVHIMKLLEIVVGEQTRADVVAATRALGERIGKEVITVKDAPGFATSRLGVCLGMEAIRMVEQGVASAEDIDTAMVLGYRHPIGPLKLTDLVGLDVRMHIGEYLAVELSNDAFRPPELMRQMVADGKLGKKTGQGFYSW